MFKESIKMSWQNIIHHKMRSFLTVLGIIIGVGSIIALITIVSGVTDSITAQVSDMGANTITVQVEGSPLKAGLLASDLEELDQIANIKGISPTIQKSMSISFQETLKEDVMILGKNGRYFIQNKDLLEKGRRINLLDVEQNTRVCVIGFALAQELFPLGGAIEEKIKIGGQDFLIIGVMAESGSNAMGSNDDNIIIPYTTAQKLFATPFISTVEMFMEDGKLVQSTSEEIEAVLNRSFHHKEESFSVSNMQDIMDTVESMTAMMTMMLGGIASISLVVGGIGIMNMMLVSVTERTSEIGLRKALGASPKRIQQQFLLEAIFLCLFGGILGCIAGIGIAFLICLTIGSSFSLSGSIVFIAVGFSVVIGVIFGFSPAKRASEMNPIEALRM